MTARIDQVLRSWSIAGLVGASFPPTPESEIARAERTLGRAIPHTLRTLYGVADGLEPLYGNLQVVRLHQLIGFSSELRGYGWPIPQEVLVFGGDGCDDYFGLWLGAEEKPDPPVIQIGEIFEPRSFAVIGTTMTRFLTTWSAYYLVLLAAPPLALDALEVPPGLPRPGEAMNDGAFRAINEWADPDLPDPIPDPYRRGLTREELIDLLGP